MEQKHLIITVGREYGSGGHDIAKALAARLNLPFYDNELITLAAEKSGLGEKAFATAEQVSTSVFGFAFSSTSAAREYGMNMNDKVFLIQSTVIREVADRESAVIVGRCSNYVLQEYAPTINIFIGANPEDRIRAARMRENLATDADARKFVTKMDKYRASYYNFYTSGGRWGGRKDYDLCINRSGLDIDTTVAILENYVNLRRAAMGL